MVDAHKIFVPYFKRITSQFRLKREILICMILFLMLIAVIPLNVSAQESAIIDEYAPIFYFEQEEICFPVSVEYHVNHSSLYRFSEDEHVEVLSEVSLDDLADYTASTDSSLYLDNTIGTITDDAIINDYNQQKNSLDYTVYTHTIDESSDVLIIQYWVFYAFNKGDLNQHEGDWELVQIVFQQGSPTEVMYSQHHSGQRATWDQVEKTGTHPHVYVARGSHANYFTSYSGTLGMASDHVGSNGFVLKNNQYTLVDLTEQNWLPFQGRWGETNSYEDIYLGRAGSYGPMYRDGGAMWNQPLEWGANLPELNGMILLLEWFIYNFVTIFIVVTIISLAVISYRLLKKYNTDGFGPRFFSFLYIDGINGKSIGNMLFIVGIILAIAALVYPWYGISASSTSQAYNTEGVVDILTIDGIQGVSMMLPDASGPTPLGSVLIPFSLLIGIGIIFTFIKTIGVKESKKLGKSYIYQGIRLILPVIAIVIAIILISFVVKDMVPMESQTTMFTSVFDDIASSPFSGSSTTSIDPDGGSLQVTWGIQVGGFLLLLSGIILCISGFLERKDAEPFF